jgi:hypothetical protein
MSFRIFTPIEGRFPGIIALRQARFFVSRPIRQTGVMPDLRRRALAEIRKQAGCHNAFRTSPSIALQMSALEIIGPYVLSAGAADATTAARAALHVQSALRRDYDLMTD